MPKTFYALLVGIDRYRAPVPALNGCVNDIEVVAALFQELGAGGGFSIDLRTLKDAEATRAAVIAGFRDHLRRAGPEDVALFYYSGHGSQEDAPPELWHLEPDRLDETLVCYDSREEGSWDLADKELGALIAQVAERDAHVVAVLDCCHSGSGTRASLDEGIAVRRAPTDRRRRTLDSFLDGALSTQIAGGEEPSAGWSIMPSGKHLLLAACRASETAKEIIEQGKPHGAFTAALLATLRQSRGSITYRDLLKRAEAQVRLRVAQQVPQVEASDPADLQRPFLGGAVRRERAYFTLRYDGQLGWVIDGGAIHGIPQPMSGETTVLAVFDLQAGPNEWGKLDAALGTAAVEEVRPELSRVKLSVPGNALDRTGTYRAAVIATPLPAMAVFLDGDQDAVTLVRHALTTAGSNGKPSLLVREAEAYEQASLRLEANPLAYSIFRARADRPLVAEVEGTDSRGARVVVERLEHVARWEAVARLENPGSRLSVQPVEIVVLRPLEQAGRETWEQADPRRGISLEYRYIGGEWVQPRLRIELRNRGPEDVHCALLWLGEDYSVSSSLIPGGTALIPAGASAAANSGKDIYGFVPEAKWREGRTEVRDLLKLIVSTEQFDAILFDREKLDRYATTRGTTKSVPRSALERLAARVHVRGLATMPATEDSIADWSTGQLALTVVRPLEAVEVPPSGKVGELGAGVKVIGHKSLRAKARLISPAEAGRDLGAFGLPAILRDDPEVSQPFLFETPRGTDPGLGALELFEITNPDSVTADMPLTLRVAAQIQDGDHILPFAWDGEFFLPLGAGRQVGDSIEIELRQLPSPRETTRDIERGIFKSVRILFQKIASSYLGTSYSYPQLAAVSWSPESDLRYETATEVVRAAVAKANRILLHVHGILGDTLGMTASVRAEITPPDALPQKISDRYDLILAFDYENINTSIEATARDLKQHLAAIDLGADHGKTLHVVAHSMGGLVSRWFIEREGGNRVVQHLFMLGTPHAGSPWPTIQNWANTALAIGLNGLGQISWTARLLAYLMRAIEKVDVALDQMVPSSPFLVELASSTDPRVAYTLLVGNTSIMRAAVESGALGDLLARLAPQRVLHAATAAAFLEAPNDIAVSVASAQAIPPGRTPKQNVAEVACDHVTFFSSDAGRQALLAQLRRFEHF